MIKSVNIRILLFVFLWQVSILFMGLTVFGFSIKWESLLLLMIFPTLFLFGGMVGLNANNSYSKNNHQLFLNQDRTLFLLKLNILVLVAISIIAAFKITEYTVLYRYIYFNSPDKIFGSMLNAYLIGNIFIPFCYFLLIRYLCFQEVASSRKILYVFLTLVPMSIITLGRFALYEIIFFLTIIFLISERISLKNILALSLGFLAPFAAAIFYFILKTDLFSGYLSQQMILDIFYQFFVNYHFIGIYFFDWIVENKEQFFVIDQFGCNSFGWIIDNFRKVFSLMFFEGISSCWRSSNLILNNGHYFEELGATYNAFSTNLSIFYLDGGPVYLIIASFSFGFVSQYFIRNKEFILQPFFIIVSFCFFFGVFRPMLNSFILFMFIIYTVIFYLIGRIYDQLRKA